MERRGKEDGTVKACPMTTDNVAKYGLTDKQVKAFCSAGCSVACQDLFSKYVKRSGRNKRGEIN